MVEVQLRQFVHTVPIFGAIEDIGNDDGVIDGREIKPGTAQDVHVEFNIVADF